MADDVAPEFVQFVNEERRANRIPAFPEQLKEGEILPPISVDNEHATAFLRLAARQAVGLFRSSQHAEIVWVHGDSQLVLNLTDLSVKLTNSLILVYIPVRCDQTGDATIEVAFAVGTADEPAGLYASTYGRPNGPALIVDVWGEMLLAFAWQCVLGMISGIAGAVGRDAGGDILVPAELITSDQGLQIVPMARYRFTRSAGSESTDDRRGEQ
jgi:hypothetical protein